MKRIGENTLIMATPALSLAIVFTGWALGGSGVARTVRLTSAPLGKNHALSWQLSMMRIDQGQREPDTRFPIAARVSLHDDWRHLEAVTDDEGVAELNFELPDTKAGDRVELELVEAESRKVLVHSFVPVEASRAAEEIFLPPVRATKREGDLPMDVRVFGRALSTGAASRVWVDLHGSDGTVEASSDDGLSFDKATAVTCKGFAELSVTTQSPASTLRIVAKDARGRHGEWFGTLPTLDGAADLTHVEQVQPGDRARIEVIQANERDHIYVEVNDASGRAYARTVKLDKISGFFRATIELPPLALGTNWISVSNDSEGAWRESGKTTFRPILVSSAPPDCAVGAELARLAPPTVSRSIAFDTTAATNARIAHRKSMGRMAALLGLLVGALIEGTLIFRILRRTPAAPKFDADEDALPTPPPSPLLKYGEAIVYFGLALLGFLLLALLVGARL